MPLTTFLKKLSPGRIIALGFLFCILLGSLLLILPCSLQTGIALPYLDALYTATSAVCVTGLNVIDPGSTFSPFGQFVLGCLIQIGGLGVASIGVGIMLAMGKKVNLKERRVIRDAMNLDSGKGLRIFHWCGISRSAACRIRRIRQIGINLNLKISIILWNCSNDLTELFIFSS